MPTIQKDLINTITRECGKRGIGLSFFNVQTGFDTVVKPAKSGVRNSPFLWMLNEMIVGGNNGGTSVDPDSSALINAFPEVKIERKLGEGGQKYVYKANTEQEGTVALKIIKTNEQLEKDDSGNQCGFQF